MFYKWCKSAKIINDASLKVWAFMSAFGLGSWRIWKDTINAEKYTEVHMLLSRQGVLQGRISVIQYEIAYCIPHNSMASQRKSPGAGLDCLHSWPITKRKHLASH